jgi:hypothetical protein
VSEPVLIRTKHAELTAEQVADALPGTGEVMRAVGHCHGMAWHAAGGGNWDLAAYFLRRVRSLMRGLAVTRPKYEAQLADFDREVMEPAYQAVLARDAAAFEAAYRATVDRANEYHVVTGHPYIRWSAPPAPPETGLDLTPG